jgi:hypothetical protein
MKISAMPAGAGGNPGTDLGNINVGQTADAGKLAAAKAIASGEEPTREEKQDPVERARDVRKIVMKTNYSTNRDDALVVPEAPVEVAPEAPSTTTDVGGQPNVAAESTQYITPERAAIAKQRRALQVKERELAEREAKIAQPPEGEFISKADLLANPLKIFDAGLTYDQLTEAILANQSGVTPEVKALRDELEALKKGVDERFVTQEQIQEESALNQIADDMESLAKSSDQYEMFLGRNGLQRALNKVYSHYKKTGQVLDNKAVMDQVENELLDEAIKLAKFKKVMSKLAPEPVQAQPQSQGKQMKTLTSRDGASIPLDRRSRAIAAMRGTLRK